MSSSSMEAAEWHDRFARSELVAAGIMSVLTSACGGAVAGGVVMIEKASTIMDKAGSVTFTEGALILTALCGYVLVGDLQGYLSERSLAAKWRQTAGVPMPARQ